MVLALIIVAIDIVLIIPLVSYFGSRKFLSILYNKSIAQIDGLGYLNSINAPIKTGKTSLGHGISHILQILTMNKIEEMFDRTKKMFKYIDFNQLDDFIMSDFVSQYEAIIEACENPSIEMINIKKTIQNLFLHFGFKDRLIYDFINIKPFSYWMYKYAEGLFVMYIRSNFVQSKTKVYSHITGKFNYTYDLNDQKIYLAYQKGEFAIYKYMVEMIDEASDDIEAEKWREEKDSGAKEYRRKYAHIFEETNRMITIKQDSSDEIKKFRSLHQSNLYIIEKVDQRGTGRDLFAIIKTILYIPVSFYKLRLKMAFGFKYMIHFIRTREKLDYGQFESTRYAMINIQRKIDNKLYYVDMFLKRIAFNRFHVLNYPSEEDVGKRDPVYYTEMTLYIPTIYCWGVFDHIEYKTIYEDLMNVSNKHANEVNYYVRENYFEKKGVDKHDRDSTVEVDFN